MKFDEYLSYFENILHNPTAYDVYQKEEYYNYAKLNWSRTNRWLKKFIPNQEITEAVAHITDAQHWILITEPWCGDAAHSVPLIYNIVKNNPAIDLDIQLRDTLPYLIDDYLTNGSKSIPKLIIRNDVGHDKATWGPRPEKLDAIFKRMKAEDRSFEEIKEVTQKWYNEDQGTELQKELLSILNWT